MRGTLAPWQERRAKELLRANLQGVPLKEVARECGLSVAHFSRAFRRTVGVAPHNWLIEQRIVRSKERLRDDRTVAHRRRRGVRLLRSKPFHASLHPSCRHESTRMAPGGQGIANQQSFRRTRRLQDHDLNALCFNGL